MWMLADVAIYKALDVWDEDLQGVGGNGSAVLQLK